MSQDNFVTLRINWTVRRQWTSPSFLGPALRGMLGRHLRKLACSRPSNKPNALCEHLADCAYCSFFERQTQTSFKLPPPFVLQPPPVGAHIYQSGEKLSCQQNIINLNPAHLPVILQAWQQAQLESAPDALLLESIEVCDHEGRRLAQWQPGQPAPAIQPQPLPAITAHVPDSIQLKLLTPLYLREQGRDVFPQHLRPAHLVMGALRRSKLMLPRWHSQTYQENLPPQLLQAWASSLNMEHQLEWHQEKRWSHRQHKEIPLKGLLGTVTLHGNLEPFWPALAMTPWIGLGKFCNFGLGHLVIK